MCGRIIQSSGPLRYAFVDGLDIRDSRLSNVPKRYNGAPSQELLVIRKNLRSGEYSLDFLKWGFIPRWCEEAKPKQKPINARGETLTTSRLFSEPYARRRCIIPVDGFLEWKATKGARQPYAIAMKDRSPFALAGLWDNWKDAGGDWVRTFTIITVPANALVGTIHDRMPLILAPADYERWLGDEPDPGDLLVPFPPAPMTLWPISTRANSWRDDDPGLIEPIALEKTA